MEQINIYSDTEIISRIMISHSREADAVKDLLSCLNPYKHIYALIDKQLMEKSPFVTSVCQALQQMNIPVNTVEVSEQLKTLDTVMGICSWLLEKGADRDALIFAIGGGITTDMVGFAASIYKRGVRFAYMPTTLLSQVDASIGGKTGVNFEQYKNILGVIRQPEFTFITPQVLASLPFRDFLSGAAELLKTFIIEDNGNYEKAIALLSSVSSAGQDAWTQTATDNVESLAELISAAAAVKAGVVSRDQFEKGERRKLNLGHTFAHAIETLARRSEQQASLPAGITHGEAVAIGMALAAKLSEALTKVGRFDAENGLTERVVSDMKNCGLPVECPFQITEMAQAMKKDKKAEGSKVHFVLPRAIGDVVTVALSVDEVVDLMK